MTIMRHHRHALYIAPRRAPLAAAPMAAGRPLDYFIHRAVLLTGAGVISALAAQTGHAETTRLLPETNVTASRLGEGVTGSSTTVIGTAELERSPGQTLQEVLERQPGLQVQTLFGGTNGASAAVDMRGFGAAGTANTLVLVNGRRLNDIDLAGVDFAAIPKTAIKSIELIRGNAGAVLYGDGASGGVINIVTKTGIGEPLAFRTEAGLGSFGQREGSASASGSVGATAVSLYGNAINSDGYRVNNRLRQRNLVGEIRQGFDEGEAYLTVSADTQHLGLPGARRVTLTSSLMDTDRKGATTPADFAEKQGINATLGATRILAGGIELVADAGIRHKAQQSTVVSPFGAAFDNYTDTSLDTVSVTPRINAEHGMFGLSAKAIAGLDFHYSLYGSDRMVDKGNAPAHRYDLDQRVLAVYVQDTLVIRPDTDLALGLRLANMAVSVSDSFNPGAPNPGSTVAGKPLDSSDTQYAFHLGLEHRPTDTVTLFGRAGRGMRLPTVDERVGQAPWGTPISFDLKTQTSRDLEAGAKLHIGALNLATSAFLMELKDELHYNSATSTNVNLDPTRRYGVENSANYRLAEGVVLKGALTYTQAQFRSGAWKGNDVPLVSHWTGNAGVSWDIRGKLAVLDTDLRYVGPRRMDNDQTNFQPVIPAHTVVDLRLGGKADWAHWSLAVQNLFDTSYYDYGIASSTTYGTYNAYPLPGRTVIGRLGVNF